MLQLKFVEAVYNPFRRAGNLPAGARQFAKLEPNGYQERKMNKLKPMRFEGSGNSIQIDADVEEDSSLSSFGDVLVTLNISSNGFSGTNEVWVQREEAEGFYRAMSLLEQSLHGRATLTSISPAELVLTVLSVSRRGNIAVSGETGYEVQTENSQFLHSIKFGFEFEPGQLTTAVQESWLSQYARK
jgi:hypothetical protein